VRCRHGTISAAPHLLRCQRRRCGCAWWRRLPLVLPTLFRQAGAHGFTSVPWHVQRLRDGPVRPHPSPTSPAHLACPPASPPCSATALKNASYSLAAPSVSSQHSFWRFALADLGTELRKVAAARKVAGEASAERGGGPACAPACCCRLAPGGCRPCALHAAPHTEPCLQFLQAQVLSSLAAALGAALAGVARKGATAARNLTSPPHPPLPHSFFPQILSTPAQLTCGRHVMQRGRAWKLPACRQHTTKSR
jgi:hypothetical protein